MKYAEFPKSYTIFPIYADRKQGLCEEMDIKDVR
jgi:hypothetical protein